MKLNDYRQAFKYMTRPDTRPPEVKKAEEQKRLKAETDRKNKKREQYGLEPIIPPQRLVETINLYDGTNYAVDSNNNIVEQKDLVKKFDNNDPSTYPSNPEQRRKLLTPQKPDVLKKEEPKQKVNYADIQIPSIDINLIQQPEQQQIPEARYNGPIENDPQFRNTIFGTDAYYRRKRNLDD